MNDLQDDSDTSSETISIVLISGVDVEMQSRTYGESQLLTWMPKSLSDRDLDAPASFMERVAHEVIKFPSSDLASRDGVHLQNDRLRSARYIEFRRVREDSPERAAILSLAKLAKTALCATAMPTDSSSWPFTADQTNAIQKIRMDSLLKCGGLKLRGCMRVGVSGQEVVEFSGRYAPKPDLSSPTTEPGEIVGRVTGHDKGEAKIRMLDQSERKIDIKFGKRALEAKTFSKLEDDRTLITVYVQVGTDKSGKPEYHYVSHDIWIDEPSGEAAALG